MWYHAASCLLYERRAGQGRRWWCGFGGFCLAGFGFGWLVCFSPPSKFSVLSLFFFFSLSLSLSSGVEKGRHRGVVLSPSIVLLNSLYEHWKGFGVFFHSRFCFLPRRGSGAGPGRLLLGERRHWAWLPAGLEPQDFTSAFNCVALKFLSFYDSVFDGGKWNTVFQYHITALLLLYCLNYVSVRW